MKKVETVYWDACVWLAWIKEERNSYSKDFPGIEYSVQLINSGEQILISSEVIGEEVKIEMMTKEHKKRFDLVGQNKDIGFIYRNQPIIELSDDIMSYYKDHKTPMERKDSDHLAIAIWHEVNHFYTFDEGKSGGMDLLSLDGNVAGEKLHICKPPLPPQLRQQRLF